MPLRRLPQRHTAAPHRRLVRAAVVALLFLVLGASTPAQEPRDEYQVKAAYLFNFARFVDWPSAAFARPGSPLVLCVAGRDPFGAALDAYARRVVQGRELRVRRDVAAPDMRACHLLFISDSEERRIVALLAAVRHAPVVTVSDVESFIDAGGTIGFVEADGRIQFELNLAAAADADVRVSSQLIRLARRVRGAT